MYEHLDTLKSQLIGSLISGTSWTRLNLLMQRLHHKDQQQSQQQLQNNRQKCIEENDQFLADVQKLLLALLLIFVVQPLHKQITSGP